MGSVAVFISPLLHLFFFETMWVLGWLVTTTLALDNLSSSNQQQQQDLTQPFGFLSKTTSQQRSNNMSSSSAGEKRKENPGEWKPTSKDYEPRYTGPPAEEMTEEQTSIRDAILASRPGTGLNGPFGPWLAVPAIAQPAQSLGKACRYGTSLSRRESELVILLTGAKFQSHTEFDIHVGEALKAGIDLKIIQAIPRDAEFSLEAVTTNLVPLLTDEREREIVKFTAELLATSKASDETYARTKGALDGKDSVLVEITSIVGYYAFVSYTLNVFQIPS